MAVPEYYRNFNIRHWSHTKLTRPMSNMIAEYCWRQPRFYAAKHDLSQTRPGSPAHVEASMRMRHLNIPTAIQMLGGTATHKAAFGILNGEDPNESIRHAISSFQGHEPIEYSERDQLLSKHLVGGDGELISKTINHSVEGLREAFHGANQVDSEIKVESVFPHIEVPTLGYLDGQTSKIIGELKTKWDTVDKRSKSGFKLNSIPKELGQVPSRDIQQVAIYQHLSASDRACKIIYANRNGYVVHDIPQEKLDEALDEIYTTMRKRQRLLERNETFEHLCEHLEVDFTHWLWRDWPPSLLEEVKSAMAGDQSAVPAGWRNII